MWNHLLFPLMQVRADERVYMLPIFLSRRAFICNAKEMKVFLNRLSVVVGTAHEEFGIKTV